MVFVSLLSECPTYVNNSCWVQNHTNQYYSLRYLLSSTTDLYRRMKFILSFFLQLSTQVPSLLSIQQQSAITFTDCLFSISLMS